MHDRLRAFASDDIFEFEGRCFDRVVPCDGSKMASPFGANSFERGIESLVWVADDAVIGNGALAAKRTSIDRIVPIATNPGDYSILLDYGDSTGVIAVSRTCSKDDFIARHRSASDS